MSAELNNLTFPSLDKYLAPKYVSLHMKMLANIATSWKVFI
jgi:hypothetical protein